MLNHQTFGLGSRSLTTRLCAKLGHVLVLQPLVRLCPSSFIHSSFVHSVFLCLFYLQLDGAGLGTQIGGRCKVIRRASSSLFVVLGQPD